MLLLVLSHAREAKKALHLDGSVVARGNRMFGIQNS
jgi:hypothetical protein